MNREILCRLAEDYFDDALTVEQTADFEKHLAHCQHCQDELQGLAESEALLREAWANVRLEPCPNGEPVSPLLVESARVVEAARKKTERGGWLVIAAGVFVAVGLIGLCVLSGQLNPQDRLVVEKPVPAEGGTVNPPDQPSPTSNRMIEVVEIQTSETSAYQTVYAVAESDHGSAKQVASTQNYSVYQVELSFVEPANPD